MTEQKLIILNKKDIDSLKSIFEDSEIISDENKKSLTQKRERARTDNLVLGTLFLFSFDTLSDYSHLFENEDNKKLGKNVNGYLSGFSDVVSKLRELLGDYEEDSIGSYYDGERIKDYVKPNRQKMSSLVNILILVIFYQLLIQVYLVLLNNLF